MEYTKSLQLRAGILKMVSGESSGLNITVKWIIVPLYIYKIPGIRCSEPFSGFPELLQQNTDFIS
jgi:hypothetical protein